MSWLNAQTINERLAALRSNPAALGFFDPQRAEKRLASWKDIPAFEDEEVFARRLALDKCSFGEFMQLLGTPPEKIFAEGYKPAWLKAVFASEANAATAFTTAALDDAAQRGMIAPFLPLLRMYASKLLQGFQKHYDLIERMQLEDKAALDLLLSPLIGRIEYLTRRAIVLEINVQRMLGLLQGETSEERFASFSSKMENSTDRLAFLEKYPVLTRSMQRALELWLEASIEFLDRLAADSAEIQSRFGIAADDSLSKFEPGAGDIHCKGRSVVILTFKSGKKILYKPRDLQIDESFKSLLGWCNGKGLDPPLRSIAVLAKDHYGWVEFIQNFPCKNEQELALFYKRLGVWLCLLHSLVTVDMHFENIIAAGSDPVIIDLETLFHGEGIVAMSFLWASDLDAQKIRHSVMGVGLLPAPVVSEGNQTFDVSAIGASVGQQAPYKVTLLQNMGKDNVHIAHVPGWIPSVHSRPTEEVENKIPYNEILEGYEACYRFLLRNREELLAAGGPIDAFALNSRRLIIRNTRLYGGLSIDAGHPDLLRDDLDRAWHWDNLWNEVRFRPLIENFMESEMNQILDGDIPFFTIGLDGLDAVGADGSVIEGVIPESGLSLAKQRIMEMSESGLKKQNWFIRSSLGYVDGYQRKPEPSAGAHCMRPLKDGRESSRGNNKLLNAAMDVGDQVLSDLTFFEETASCIDVACLSGENESSGAAYAIAPAGVELYDGLGGICLFLAYLARETDDDAYRQAAEALLRNIQMIMANRQNQWSRMSGFLGLGSLVYVYSHLAQLWDRDDLLEEAEKFVQDIPHALEHDDTYDVLMGSAGAILCLLSLAKVNPKSAALETAVKCGDYILAHARAGKERAPHNHDHEVSTHGAGEPPAHMHEHEHDHEHTHECDHALDPVTDPWKSMAVKRGFSHGLCGVSYALHELAVASGKNRFRDAALEAIEIERNLLSGSNWTDQHMYNGRPQLSWCHGASGIALGRLGIFRYLRDLQIKNDIQNCLQECSKNYWMTSQCLCHGSLGNIEPLIIAASEFPEFGDWRNLINEASEQVLKEIAETGWRSMLPNQTLSNGLMTGISGIGFAFLRIHNPNTVPSILSVAKPVKVPAKSRP